MRIILAIIILTLYLHTINASPKREMRAIWVTTVTNIDFPQKPGSTPKTLKKEINYLLDQHQRDGINAIFFQVRPASDAFYKSSYEPWSKYLTGDQNKSPLGGFDPLGYMIEQAHKRQMEVHAWVNPFRVRLNTKDKLCKSHPYTQHPNWGWDYDNKTYYDPGLPAVRRHTRNVIVDIVRHYDIDGIHFDDYFYPYRKDDHSPLPDQETFKYYGGKYYPNNIHDWRRENINIFIQEVSKAIKEEKAWVKFGISPFGIWKNSSTPEDKLPTINGLSNYDRLYADIIKWMKEGWIDYCVPQLYWAIGYAQADYEKLLHWWDKNSFGRNIYVGHSLYKINKDSEEIAWRSPKEIERQIKALRATTNFSGSAFYSSNHLLYRDDVRPLRNTMRNELYKDIALPPEMPWIDNKSPNAPRNIQFAASSNGNLIYWDEPNYKDDMNKAFAYIIYKIDKAKKSELTAGNIITITNKTNYRLPLSSKGGIFAITSLDRMKNESKASTIAIEQQRLNSVVFLKSDETFTQLLLE